jgi:hypothetical protein
LGELVEAPRVVAATLSFPNRCLVAYPFQLFQDDCASSVFRFHHQLLADDMVHVSSMAGFASAELLQMPLRTFGVASLEFGFDSIHAKHGSIHIFSFVSGAIRVYGKVHDAEVDAEGSNWIVLACFGRVHYGRKIESSVAEDEVCLSTYSVHAHPLVFADSDGYKYASFQGQDACLFKPFPREDALIVHHCTMKPECGFLGPVSLVGFADFRYGANRHLS